MAFTTRPSRSPGRLLAVTVVAGLAATAAPVAAPAAAADGRWRVVPVTPVAGQATRLVDADPIDATSAWVVGTGSAPTSGTPDYPQTPVVHRFANGTMTRVPITDPVGGNVGEGPTSVAANGPDDAWMASLSSEGSTIRRWNGTAWQKVPFDLLDDNGNPPQVYNITVGGGQPFVRAFGGYDEIGYDGAIATYVDGEWSYLPDLPVATHNTVDAASATSVWTAGGVLTEGSRYGSVYEWNGTSWILRLQGDPSCLYQNVVANAPDDVLVTGGCADPVTWESRDVLLHWDGTDWTELALPEGTNDGRVTRDAAGNVWLQGVSDRPDRVRYLTGPPEGPLTAVDGPVRRGAFNLDVNDLVTLPGRAEPLVVGTANVLGTAPAALVELRRPL